jgi:hypothetical protein
MFVCCECCVLSGRGLCDGLITRPEKSYLLWRVVVCDQETSKNEEAKARYWAVENKTRWVVTPRKQTISVSFSNNLSSRMFNNIFKFLLRSFVLHFVPSEVPSSGTYSVVTMFLFSAQINCFCHRCIKFVFKDVNSGFGGLEVACWPLVPKFAGSNPAEAVGFFGRKNPQHAFLRRGSKAVCPMSCFTACKRTQK